MKVLVGAFNKEKAVVGAFTVNVKTGCETDGWSASLVCIPGHQDAWVGAGPSCVSSPHVQAPHQPHGIGTEDRNIEPIHTITIWGPFEIIVISTLTRRTISVGVF